VCAVRVVAFSYRQLSQVSKKVRIFLRRLYRMSQSAVALSKHICLQQRLKMFVADVNCPQTARQTVPNSWACSAKASVSKTVVRTWHRAHVIRGRPKGSSVAFGDEMDVISQVDRHLTVQCLSHQTGEFELHSQPNRKPV